MRVDMMKQGNVDGDKLCQRYPTGQKYSLGLMFAKFATAKIGKDLNPLKITYNRL